MRRFEKCLTMDGRAFVEGSVGFCSPTKTHWKKETASMKQLLQYKMLYSLLEQVERECVFPDSVLS